MKKSFLLCTMLFAACFANGTEYLFDTQAKLCDALAVKYELGVKTRAAYETGDKAELERLAEVEYTKAIKLIDTFGRALEKQWLYDNKPNGFDVQDMRIGGLIRRLTSCKRRLLDYAKGNIDKIEELEQSLLPFVPNKPQGESISFNSYLRSSTVNSL